MSAQATLALIGRSCYAFLDTSSSAPVLFFFNQLEENGEGKISNQPRHTHAAITDLQHARWHLNHMTLNLEMWFLKLHFLHHLVELLHSSSTRTHGNILKKYRAFFPHWSHLQILRAPEPGHRNSILFFFIKALVQSSQADFWSHYWNGMCITSSAPYSELLIYQKAVIHMNEIESLVSYETFISKQQAYPVIINKDTQDANCPWIFSVLFLFSSCPAAPSVPHPWI